MALHEVGDIDRRQRRRYLTGFPIRCTEQEKAEIFARAARVNRSASRFLVELAMRPTGPGFASQRSEAETVVLEGLMVQLRRVASNLQELARDHHLVSRDGEVSPATIDDTVVEIRQLLAQIRERVV